MRERCIFQKPPVRLVWLVTLLLLTVPALAADPLPELAPIEPAPLMQPGGYVPQAAVDAATHYGFVEGIVDGGFVIADVQRFLSPEVVLRSRPNGPATSKSAFRVGDWVGFLLDDERRIREIWLDEVPPGVDPR